MLVGFRERKKKTTNLHNREKNHTKIHKKQTKIKEKVGFLFWFFVALLGFFCVSTNHKSSTGSEIQIKKLHDRGYRSNDGEGG